MFAQSENLPSLAKFPENLATETTHFSVFRERQGKRSLITKGKIG